MRKILIASDQLAFAQEVGEFFNQRQWSTDTVGINALVGAGSSTTKAYSCVIVVIDPAFRRRFGELITEMTALIRNVSQFTPIYLIVENEAPPELYMWKPFIRQRFDLKGDMHQLHEVLPKILHQACPPIANSAFVSPEW